MYSDFKEIILNILHVTVEKPVNIPGITTLMCPTSGPWAII